LSSGDWRNPFAGQSNIMPRRRANVGRRMRRAERATATRGRVQLVAYIAYNTPVDRLGLLAEFTLSPWCTDINETWPEDITPAETQYPTQRTPPSGTIEGSSWILWHIPVSRQLPLSKKRYNCCYCEATTKQGTIQRPLLGNRWNNDVSNNGENRGRVFYDDPCREVISGKI
jgi:hypothetical protein